MTTDVHSLIAPYALDALDADERARFEVHLDQCDDCRSELGGFLATAARLGDVPSQQPPAEFKARLMEVVSNTPQERPIVTALAGRSKLRRALPRSIAAAATVIALAGIGGFAVEHERNSDLRADQAAMTRILAASDAERSVANLKTGGSLQMLKSARAGGAVLIASDLPKVSGKTYQLWTIADGKAKSQGLIAPASSMKLVKDTSGADTVAITIEPEGGSKAPTTTPIAAMPV